MARKLYATAMQSLIDAVLKQYTHGALKQEENVRHDIPRISAKTFLPYMSGRVAAQTRTTLAVWASLITILLHHFRLHSFNGLGLGLGLVQSSLT